MGDRVRRVEVENSGLVIFVYDEANAERIREAAPEILDGFGDEMAEEEALQRLAAEGVLVVYELQSDDPRTVDVYVGSEPTADALGDPSWWLRERRARLSLPSGKLCIEGYDCLRVSEEWQFQAERHRERTGEEYPYTGAVVDVPAGEYVLAIRQLEGVSEEAEDVDVPTDFLVLTPASEAGPVGPGEGIHLLG